MELRIIADGISITPEARDSIERRLNEHAARFGPIERATITIARGRLRDPFNWRVSAELELPPSWTIRPDGTGASLDDALAMMFLELTALFRHVSWLRDGVPRPCRWCGHEAFIYVRHPTDRDETLAGAPLRLMRSDAGEWRGELECLVCKACGYIDWFVRDPRTLPIGDRGVIEVTTRKPDPYRG